MPAPHIALILPLSSPVFSDAASSVQQGFMEAVDFENRGRAGMLPVRVYSTTVEDGELLGLFRQALDNGALAVVGALTRDGANLLAAERDVPVPTLLLNSADEVAAYRMYCFGMAVESEAKQLAQLARQQGYSRAIVITTPSQLSKRLQFAFEQEWYPLGAIEREIEFSDDPAVLSNIADSPDTLVFLATDVRNARQIRPYLPIKMPIYATSQVFVGADRALTNYDLDGIRFVDMPWLLQPDHPAVMTYARASLPLSVANERFYALGIDAFRLIRALLDNRIRQVLPLDGVSGEINLHGHVFQRAAIPAMFTEGRVAVSNKRGATLSP